MNGYLVALGGNALDDRIALGKASKAIAELHSRKERVVVTHGNGPQVGHLADVEDENLAVLTARTEADIGIDLEKSISKSIGDSGKVAIVLTRCIVSRSDKAFRNPTKPIGSLLVERDAMAMRRKGFSVRKLIKGYRRVVPSPVPRKILEVGEVKELLARGYVVIACGGGGIAVFRKSGGFEEASAVIDKDLASALLASELGFKRFVVLTNVDGVYLDYGKRGQKMLGRVGAKEMKSYLDEGAFEEGSMKPKVGACINFVRKTDGYAAIGSLGNAGNAMNMKDCTVIVP